MKMSQKCADYEVWLGCIALVSAAVIILEMVEVIPHGTWGYVWPVMLGLLGLKMVFSGTATTGSGCECGGEHCNCKMETGAMPMSMPSPVVIKRSPAKKTPVKRKMARR